MPLHEISGHVLKVGDRVKMNIEGIGQGSPDGVEFTKSGKNYWRYMNQHPDEVYTITKVDFSYDDCPYFLSGYMDTNWAADELILVPIPASRFEVIKNMTLQEMAKDLLPMVLDLCEDGVPTQELVSEWLSSAPDVTDERRTRPCQNIKKHLSACPMQQSL
mgnify:CR=1 FL=1